MRSFLTGIVLPILTILVPLSFHSCSEDEPVPNPTHGLTCIAEGWVPGAATRIEVWAGEPAFTGYNPLTILLIDSITTKPVTDATVTLVPVMQMMEKSHSCPVEIPVSKVSTQTYTGAVLFTMPSGDAGNWTLNISVERGNPGHSGNAVFPIVVQQKDPSPVIIFKTDTDEKLILAGHFLERPKIGSNAFEVICFRVDGHSFTPVDDLSFIISTEMPSMDHGSPNNVDPLHDSGGHYKGQVNFTMSGDWRIRFNISRAGNPLAEKYFDVLVQ